MSGKKQRRSKRSGPGKSPSRSPATRSGRKKNADAASGERKDLRTSTLLTILLPFLALCSGVAWYVIGSGEPDLSETVREEQTAGIDNDHGTSGSSSRTGNKNWTTIGHQEKSWNEIDDASADGWDTEVASERVTEQLNKLKKVLASDKPVDASTISHLTDDQLTVYSVTPKQLETAFETPELRVQRAHPDTTSTEPSGTGAERLATDLKDLLQSYVDRPGLRMKLKVFQVEQTKSAITTSQTLEVYGKSDSGIREINAVWQCDWTRDKKPRMKSIRLTQFECVDVHGETLFSDCTESVFGANQSFRQQLLRGYDHWLNRQQVHNAFMLLANNGIAVGDVNADGLEDVYLCQESGLPNLLFLQQPDGTLKDVSRESGVDWIHNSSAALIVDLDNDGHQDLAVGVSSGLVIARGDSSGSFQVEEALDCSDEIWSLTAADYDRDGLLDLYVGTYSPTGVTSAAANIVLTESLEDYTDGGLNTLFHNESADGKFRFQDVTETVGLMINNRRRTYSVGWEDYDKDGDQDLYVANDFGWNNFYRHDTREDGSSHFVDIAEPANARDDSFGMSVNWGDYDRDGWMDLYISNMYSYAGNRITYQDQFKADDGDNVKKRFQRYARGNTLLRNTGQPEVDGDQTIIKFEDRSLEAAVNMGRWAWSSCFLDVNNDGWEDLFVNNGYITTTDNGDL